MAHSATLPSSTRGTRNQIIKDIASLIIFVCPSSPHLPHGRPQEHALAPRHEHWRHSGHPGRPTLRLSSLLFSLLSSQKLVVIGGTVETARRASVSAWNGFVDCESHRRRQHFLLFFTCHSQLSSSPPILAKRTILMTGMCPHPAVYHYRSPASRLMHWLSKVRHARALPPSQLMPHFSNRRGVAAENSKSPLALLAAMVLRSRPPVI